MARQNITVTLTNGAPICVATGLSSAAMIAAGYQTIPAMPLNELCMQMKHGGAGIGYVMSGIRGVTSATQLWRVPAIGNVTDVSAEMTAATATAPGGSWTDPTNNQTVIHGEQTWVDGTTGDQVIITYDTQAG